MSPIEKLRRFIQLESSRGYDNRAVVGGLKKFQPVWQKEASGSGVDGAMIETVNAFLDGYESLDIEGRKQSSKTLLGKIPAGHDRSKQKTDRKTPLSPPDPNRKPGRKNQSDPSQREPRAFSGRRDAQVIERVERPAAAVESPAPTPDSEPWVQEAAPVVKKTEPEDNGDLCARERRNLRKRAFSPDDPSVDSPVTRIPGIGPQNANALSKQNVHSVRDLLYYFPRRYDDYSLFKMINKVLPGETVTIIGIPYSVENQTRGKYQITEAVIGDGTGYLRVTWFNQPWLIHQIHLNQAIVLSGKVDTYLGRPVMSNPEWEPGDQDNLNTNRIVPVYSVNANLKQNFLRRMIYNTVRHWSDLVPEFLPDSVLESVDLLPLTRAIEQIHFPSSHALLREAQKRLAFDEYFLLQLSVLTQKRRWTTVSANRFEIQDVQLETWMDNLPYRLTNAQLKAVSDIRADLRSGSPMNRLVQGDVGSGKTIVASLAVTLVANADGQSVIMAPTGILAEQHYRNYLAFLERIRAVDPEIPVRPERTALLVGSTPEAQKREIREKLQSGEILVVIGTHALIEETVQFRNLEFVVIDEQHRFGVEQRATLRAKGESPHLLIMTATPIPRSLALTIYGDLDLTVIDEMPPGRVPVETYLLLPVNREGVYNRIRKEVKTGHQAFIIYPLVESAEATEENNGSESDSKSAVEAYQKLQEVIFPDLRVMLLHGRMKGEEKDAILEAFKNGDGDILVSTSVIEVGVDVPNATIMLIEGADRFGLAQLHQFRGRVGRGTAASTCILIPERDTGEENERLKAMTETNDGFALAEKDLNLRGPGDFLGSRQSGYLDFSLASLLDIRMIEKARNEALKLFELDPELLGEQSKLLREKVNRILTSHTGENN